MIGAVNRIFTETSWLFDEEIPIEERTNYGLKIDKIIVHPTETFNMGEHYNSPNSSTIADNILELFGKNEDWSSYCLAHLFTYQAFENSVLGLAYVASPLTYTLGGICSKSLGSRNGVNSVNTGLSSYKSTNMFQKRLMQREGELGKK